MIISECLNQCVCIGSMQERVNVMELSFMEATHGVMCNYIRDLYSSKFRWQRYVNVLKCNQIKIFGCHTGLDS